MNDICVVTDLDREICEHCDETLIPAAPILPGVYEGISDRSYHRDDSSLSSSGARKLLKPGGPAKFKHGSREESDAFDIGHATHTLLLGVGAELVEVKADTWQSKAAKDARKEARREGKTPLLSKQLDTVQAMVDAAQANPEVAELLSGGRAEVSGYAMDPATWVMMRARPDYLHDLGGQAVGMVDYKTTADASPAAFARSAANYGYHLQEDWYRTVWTELGYTVERFTFIAQEKEPPYLVSIHEFSPHDVYVGGVLNDRARRLFARCQDSGDWPGYGNAVHTMRLPAWATRDGEEW